MSLRKQTTYILSIYAIFLCAVLCYQPIDYVDPLIGTGGFGFGVGGDPVGVQVPFGAVRISPDGSDGDIWLDFLHFGGYHYSDTTIRCFSHTHMVGSGVSDFGNIGIMPTEFVPTNTTTNQYWFQQKFSHENEDARPHHYGVRFDSGIVSNLTVCGSHTAKQIHTFPATEISDELNMNKLNQIQGKYVVFDLGHSLSAGKDNGVVQSFVNISWLQTVSELKSARTEITGYVLNRGSLTGRNGVGVLIYFAAVIADTPTATAVGDRSRPAPKWNSSTAHGEQVGAVLQFHSSRIEVTSAISFVSIDQARRNLDVQTNKETKSFSDCVGDTYTIWNRSLSSISVEGPINGTTTYRKFYTGLYHSMLAPTLWSEEDGVYLGMDNQTYIVPDGTRRYTDMSIWDIHRTQVPLLDLLRPDVSADIARSLVGMYLEGGDIPRWPIANVYAACMIGSHSNIMFAGMLAKNITDFNVTAAYEGIYLQATEPNRPHVRRDGLADYIKNGFVPTDKFGKAASLTLAYAYDDAAVAAIAAYLGKHKDAAVFANRSLNYQNVWDKTNGYMCPRNSNGTFRCNKNPNFHEWILSDSGFCEGNAAEWRWFVPHDLPGFVKLFGGPRKWVEELSIFFDKTWSDPTTALPNPHYWAGNEPDILEPFQFHAAGRADLSQQYSRHVMDFAYSDLPDGLPGNDDYGTLSAWFVWAAIGMYPLAGTDTYFIGSPIFNHTTIYFEEEGSLEITAYNATIENMYVIHIELDGRPIDIRTANVTHHEIKNAKSLVLHMSNTP